MPVPEVYNYQESAHSSYRINALPKQWEPVAGYEVIETIPKIPYTDFHEKSFLTEQQYYYLHGFSLATILAFTAIPYKDRVEFPGMPANGIANFEYAAKSPEMTGWIEERIKKNLEGKISMSWLDIGGQEGIWSTMMANRMHPSIKNKNVDILDLDLYRRSKRGFPQWLMKGINLRYIQGDAHRFSSISQELKLPKYDVISMINVHDFIFDPISVLAQAWDRLADDGFIILGRSYTDSRGIPLSVESDNPDILGVTTAMTDQGQVRLEDEFDKWKSRQERVTSAIPPDKRFHFVQPDPEGFPVPERINTDEERERIAQLSSAAYGLPPPFEINLPEVLKYLGVRAEETEREPVVTPIDSEYQIGKPTSAIIIFKDGKTENPFAKLKIFGLVKQDFHMNEYAFPQVLRRIKL